jgi:hypothetical protein
MAVERPWPILDLPNDAFITCLGMAAVQHAVAGSAGQEPRPRARFDDRHLRWARASGRVCPYCLGPEPAGGEEHVLSVALGNWFWVIPPGVVCDRCNNTVLSVLDTRLQQHPLIAMLRVLAGVAGRRGQPPVAGASNLRLRRDETGKLHIEADSQRHVTQGSETVELTPNWQNFGPPQRRTTARALLKLGLGTLWLGRGPDETGDARYDHVRDAIRDEASVPMQYGFGNSKLPSTALQIMVLASPRMPSVHVSLDYFGVQLWAQSEGYRHEASAWFLAREIDEEFA